MSCKIPFVKMDGAGNDYIYVETLHLNLPNPSAAARRWSAYHTGIGSDGLVLIGKPTILSGADFSMRIFNADGSEAMMCGNASRCVGKYLYEKGLTTKDKIRLETKSGVKILSLSLSDAVNERGLRTVENVTVDMLEPRFDVAEQFTGNTPDLRHLPGLSDQGAEVRCSKFVSMGNPHFVIFVDDISKVDVAKAGSRLEYDPAFPARCNIEFAQVRPDGDIRTRVWERGSGITMACGTGACATAVAAAFFGLAHRKSHIQMDGGRLGVEWQETDNHVMLLGPAEFDFEGWIAADF